MMSNFPPDFDHSSRSISQVDENPEAFGIAGLTWTAATALFSWISDSEDSLKSDPSFHDLQRSETISFLEIGSGNGNLAISLAQARTLTAASRWVMTDLESVVPLLQMNLETFKGRSDEISQLSIEVLEWGDVEAAISYRGE